MAELLSLETFQPAFSHAPYLNSPRSLEACRSYGVKPVELIEVSFQEFQAAHPHEDSDLLLRRWKRMDASRRQILDAVIDEWKGLCENEWKAESAGLNSSGFSVADTIPSNVIEKQAARFRKIEQQQLKAVQKIMFRELKDAASHQRNKTKFVKNDEIYEKRLHDQAERLRANEEIRQEAVVIKKIHEDKKVKLIKSEQLKAVEEFKEQEEKKELELKEKLKKREQLEAERARRTEFSKQLKESIQSKMEARIEEKIKQQEMLNLENANRVEALQAQKEAELNEKRGEVESKIEAARLVKEQELQWKTEQTLRRRRDFDERAKRRKEEIAKQRHDELERKLEMEQKKAVKAREDIQAKTNEKLEKTLTFMEEKDEASVKELKKVEDFRLKRLELKKIRQDNFNLLAARRKQAQDHRILKITNKIKRKEDRIEIIKKAEKETAKLRFAVSESMAQTKEKLMHEISVLEQKGKLDPDIVAKTVLSTSSSVLFPTIQRLGSAGSPILPYHSSTASLYDNSVESRATSAPLYKHLQRHSRGSHSGIRSRSISPSDHSIDQSLNNNSHGSLSNTLPISLISIQPEAIESAINKSKIGAEQVIIPQKRVPSQQRSRSRKEERRTVGLTTDLDILDTEGGFDSLSLMSPLTMAGNSIVREMDIEENNLRNVSMDNNDTSSLRNRQQSSSGKSTNRISFANKKRNNVSSIGEDTYVYGDAVPNNSLMLAKAPPAERLSTIVRGRTNRDRDDPQYRLEIIRREQNSELLQVLEEERLAELERERAARSLGLGDLEERRQLDLVFAEERRRASERIIGLTKSHESQMREAILNMDKTD